MKSSTDFKTSDSFALLIQGPPMTGKTTLAIQFPDPWIADCDMKLSSAVRAFPKQRFWFDTIDVDDAGKPVPDELRWLRLIEVTKKAATDPEPRTLIVDSLTRVATYLVDYLLTQPSTSTKGADKESNYIVGGQKAMTMRLWGPFQTLLIKYISLLRASGKMVICIAHEKTIETEDGGITGYRPLIPGALRDHIASLFTEVWRTEVNTRIVDGRATQAYTVRTRGTNLLNLGTSVPSLPTEYVFSWNDFSARLAGTVAKLAPGTK